MNFWEIFDTSMNFNCCRPPGSKHTRRNAIQIWATVISQETTLVFQENENHQWKRTKNVWNRSDNVREGAEGKNLHKIQQKKVEQILKRWHFSCCVQYCRVLIPTETNGAFAQKIQKLKNKQSHIQTYHTCLCYTLQQHCFQTLYSIYLTFPGFLWLYFI